MQSTFNNPKDVPFAVGSYGDSRHKYLQPLVGRLANGDWTLTRAPAPNAPLDTSRGSLSGVACATPNLCFAVGAYDTDYGAQREACIAALDVQIKIA